MKSFYTAAVSSPAVAGVVASMARAAQTDSVLERHSSLERAGERSVTSGESASASLHLGRSELCPARIAVYDAQGAPPRVEEIAPVPVGEYISQVASRTYEIARAMGGSIPYAVVNEVVENFIHADFREPVVTILDSGDTIRFSDQGPGITDKLRALEPGYTTATREMKRYVRGVGSGLPLARECMSFSGGSLRIEDNLGCGAVVTVSNKREEQTGRGVISVSRDSTAPASASPATHTGHPRPSKTPLPGLALIDAVQDETSATLQSNTPQPANIHTSTTRLTNRQKRVLALVMDAESAGPSLVARELTIGLSTAYRDLAKLEEYGLISADVSGKRIITESGARFLTALLHAE